MSEQTFVDYLRGRYAIEADGRLTDFLSRRDGRLLLADQVDLTALAERYGAPLEIAYCPLITSQVENMRGWAEDARAATGYSGSFLYAYATKANFAEEVVRTALNAGAHYETSAAADVMIAHHLWAQGTLADDRYIFCNGSKEPFYIDAIVRLREAGYSRVVPILDDLDELDMLLARCSQPLLLGVRERHPSDTVNPVHPGGERFGLTPDEVLKVAKRLEGTPHKLVVYHAMVGSQLEQIDGWMGRLARSAGAYCQLRQQVPSLHMFNFGGGMPASAYDMAFSFDYAGFMQRLLSEMVAISAAYHVPQPDVIGEFGRYTVASHSVFLMEVGSVKQGQGDMPDWYLMNGSMMVTLPDTLIVDGQQFITLPLSGWDEQVAPARLGGRRTCDSDDMYPQPSLPPLMLPRTGAGTVVAFFGIGAYQQMISGRGGAHHCLSPEARRIIIERDGDALVVREIAPQNVETMMSLLGYAAPTMPVAPRHEVPRQPVLVSRPMPARRAATPRRRSSIAPRAWRDARVARA